MRGGNPFDQLGAGQLVAAEKMAQEARARCAELELDLRAADAKRRRLETIIGALARRVQELEE
ncbi:MAG: hypothetical protein V3S01_06850 [Dehalococcoidia bacterium]